MILADFQLAKIRKKVDSRKIQTETSAIRFQSKRFSTAEKRLISGKFSLFCGADELFVMLQFLVLAGLQLAAAGSAFSAVPGDRGFLWISGSPESLQP